MHIAVALSLNPWGFALYVSLVLRRHIGNLIPAFSVCSDLIDLNGSPKELSLEQRTWFWLYDHGLLSSEQIARFLRLAFISS